MSEGAASEHRDPPVQLQGYRQTNNAQLDYGIKCGNLLATSKNLCAGGPSIMMLIQRICMALSGFGSFMIVQTVIKVKAAMLLQ